jgi:hypothetical protein
MNSFNTESTNTPINNSTEPSRPTQYSDLGDLRFYPKSRCGIDREFLIDRLWWWRLLAPEESQELSAAMDGRMEVTQFRRLFEDRYSESAYLYEVFARSQKGGSYLYGKPWIQCTPEQWEELARMVPNTHPPVERHPGDEHPQHWVRLQKEFNITMNDSVLQTQFLELINEVRQTRVVERCGSGQGCRRKSLSWPVIEAMDERGFLRIVLTSGQRSAVSKVRQQAREAFVGVRNDHNQETTIMFPPGPSLSDRRVA